MGDACDTTGSCASSDDAQAAGAKKGKILFATDPYCIACWAFEPVWRRFVFHYGEQLDIRKIYGGLLFSWVGLVPRNGIGAPEDLVPHFLETYAQSGQPVDPQIWLEDPPHSSWPPSIAAHVVRLMAPELEDAFLRRIRHAVHLQGKNICRPEVLADCAASLGIDRGVFAAKLEENAGQAGFDADLTEKATLRVRGFPTLLLYGDDGQKLELFGRRSYESLETAALAVIGLARTVKSVDASTALAAYRIGTTREFSELLEASHAETIDALKAAGAQSKAYAGDFLWFEPGSIGAPAAG